MIYIIVNGERHFGVRPVDRAGRGVDEVLHVVLPAPFEDVQKTDEVTINVGMRIGQRVTDAGLRREMHDALRLFLSKKLFHAATVS